MKQQDQLSTRPINSAALTRSMSLGAVIALALICLFLFSADKAKPEWPNLWILKPLIMVPVAGAGGGLFFYMMNHFSYRGGWKRVLAITAGIIGYIVALWLGTVLGLNGTYWD